jgi:hypothetical protein
MKGDPKEIWLQPWCTGCAKYFEYSEGRLWSGDDPGNCEECDRTSTKYVLAQEIDPK